MLQNELALELVLVCKRACYTRKTDRGERMAALSLPKTCSKLVGISLGTRFQEVVQLQTVPTPRAKPRELLVRMRYASDINWTAGRYIPGPPFSLHRTRGSRASGRWWRRGRGFIQGTPWFSCTRGRLASTGQFAVQLAGCHVIGACSTDEKAAFLQRIGCDRPINYKRKRVCSRS